MRLYTEGTSKFNEVLKKCVERNQGIPGSVKSAVEQIVEKIRLEGDEGLFDLTRKFDGFDPDKDGFEVDRREMKKAWEGISLKIRKSLNKMADRIRSFHEPQLEKGYTVYNEGGGTLSLLNIPVGRAGVYVPGGKAAYLSTVLMNAIPAKIAGVEEVLAASPSPRGVVVDEVLAACYLAGVDRLFRMGGAQAVAAFAMGTERVPKVDVIVGPGNVYVTEAKRQLFGTVGMDMLAGPSELVVLSDARGNARYAAYDLISQAEHGEDTFVALVTDSKNVAREVMETVEDISKREKRKKILSASLKDAPVFLVRNLKKCVSVVNQLAPEHLSVQVETPGVILYELKNAGTVYVGPYSPVAVGDYIAGINHTLPTGGSARFFSPLGVYSFMKRFNIVSYDAVSLQHDLSDIVTLSRREGLFAHGNAAAVRFETKRKRRK